MKNQLIVVAAVCVASLLTFLWYGNLAGEAKAVAGPKAPGEAESAKGAETELQAPFTGGRQAESAPGGAELESLDTSTAVAELENKPGGDAEAGLAAEIRGRVLGLDGEPIAGLRVVLENSKRSQAISSGDGSFVITSKLGTLQELLGGGYSTVVSNEAEWVTILAGNILHDQLEAELLVVVAERIECAGHVLNEGGQPLEGALLSVWIGDSFLSSIPIPMDHTKAVEPRAKTTADGRFRFDAMPKLPGAALRTTLKGFEVDYRAMSGEGRLDLEIVLRDKLEGDGNAVVGIVVHKDGSAAAGATVRLANSTTKTDTAGSFRLEYNYVSEEAPLVAVQEGLIPAHLPRFGALLKESGGQVGMQRLVLGDEPLSISGKVLDADGKPVKWMKVALHDPTAVSQNSFPIVSLESMVQGGRNAEQSDRDGSFEIGGLTAREYVVRAWNAKSLLQIISEPVPAGTDDLVLRIPADALHDRIAGVVRSRRGLPMANVQVSVALVTSRGDGGSSWVSGKSVATDELGFFEIEGVPTKHVHLTLGGDGILNASFEIEEWGDDVNAIRLEVSERCRFRLEGGDSKLTYLEVLDANGVSMMLTTFTSQGSSSSSNAMITEGSTHVLAVGEDARTVVLHNSDGEVQRIPVQFAPSEINIVSF